MRPVPELLQLLSRGLASPAEIARITVMPLVAAGMLTDAVEQVTPPPGANYVARGHGRHILVDADEMAALVEAGAAFDQGVAA